MDSHVKAEFILDNDSLVPALQFTLTGTKFGKNRRVSFLKVYTMKKNSGLTSETTVRKAIFPNALMSQYGKKGSKNGTLRMWQNVLFEIDTPEREDLVVTYNGHWP